jgi:hypothetical protein
MNRREFIAALTTATVASPILPAMAVEAEVPVMTAREAETQEAGSFRAGKKEAGHESRLLL